MKTKLDFIKTITGMTFKGFYGNIFAIYDNNGEISLSCTKPLISFGTSQGNLDERFWLLEWEELKTGDDVLLLNELQTPEPFDYEVIDSPNQKYLIYASSYLIRKNLIKKVWGYGFFESDVEKLTDIIIELEDSFIHIIASPAIEIRITKEQSTVNENLDLLVSS